MPGVVSSPFPPSRPAFPALCVAGRPVRVSLILARWYAIPCSLCVPRARSGCPSGVPQVFFCVCVHSRSRGVRAPPPLPWLVWRAHLARSRCWAPVGSFHAVCAPLCVLPRSRAPFCLLGRGGRPGHVPLLPGLGLCAPRGVGLRVWGVPTPGVWGGGWGGPARRPPSVARPGGPVGRGVALPPSVPLPSLGRQLSGCLWRRSGHGGRGPHTAPARARLLSPGAVRVAPLCAGAGLLVHRGFCGSRRLGAWRRALLRPAPPRRRGPSGGRGDRPLWLRGAGGPAPPWPAVGGGEGEDRGGVAPWFSTSLLRGGRPVAPAQTPLRRRGVPPRGTRSAGVVGQPRAPGAACRRQVSLAGGGGGGAACEPPSPEEWPGGLAGRGVALPRSVPLPYLGRQQSGRHWRCSGHGGRGPHTAPVPVQAPPPGVARFSALCAGAGLLACCGPRGSRR